MGMDPSQMGGGAPGGPPGGGGMPGGAPGGGGIPPAALMALQKLQRRKGHPGRSKAKHKGGRKRK
jgi:hypothetical protein